MQGWTQPLCGLTSAVKQRGHRLGRGRIHSIEALSQRAHQWYRHYHDFWRRFESSRVAAALPDLGGSRIIVLGMGNIGTGAYEAMAREYGEGVLGIDENQGKLAEHRSANRR